MLKKADIHMQKKRGGGGADSYLTPYQAINSNGRKDLHFRTNTLPLFLLKPEHFGYYLINAFLKSFVFTGVLCCCRRQGRKRQHFLTAWLGLTSVHDAALDNQAW